MFQGSALKYGGSALKTFILIFYIMGTSPGENDLANPALI